MTRIPRKSTACNSHIDNLHANHLNQTNLNRSRGFGVLDKNDPAQRQFILTRLIEKDGKILWGFNINAIINHLSDIMEFPNFNSKFDKPTLFMGGELSHYIT